MRSAGLCPAIPAEATLRANARRRLSQPGIVEQLALRRSPAQQGQRGGAQTSRCGPPTCLGSRKKGRVLTHFVHFPCGACIVCAAHDGSMTAR